MENNAHIMFLFLNLSHQSHAVLEAFLVCSSPSLNTAIIFLCKFIFLSNYHLTIISFFIYSEDHMHHQPCNYPFHSQYF